MGEAAVSWAAGGAGPGGLRGERQVVLLPLSFIVFLFLFLFNLLPLFLNKTNSKTVTKFP